MAYTINGNCMICGLCETVCPEKAISEGDTAYIIDAAKCTSCGKCLENCSFDAIEKG